MSVVFALEGRVGTITIDEPPANSYDLRVMREFSDAVDEAIDAGGGAVVVRSASEKFFSAGADVKRFLEGDVAANMEMIETSHATFARMAAAPAVFIAHVNGHALGGGLEIALACDVRLADEGSYKLGTPEVTLGLLPGNGGTQRLTRLVGRSRALELLLTGRTFSPQQALEMGLVAELLPADEASERVQAYAERFASGPLRAAAEIKRCVNEGIELSLEDGLALERARIEVLFGTGDATEGMTAFVEKRKPEFAGS